MAEIEGFGKPVANQTKLAFESESAEEESGGRCFVCHSDLPSATTGDRSFPEAEDNFGEYLSSVKVYWFLRQVLEVPLESLEAYLRSGRNPGEWLKICAACDKEFVEEVWRIWRELGEILRRFRVARGKLVEAIKKSVETELRDEEEVNGDKQFIRDICEETRRFAVDFQYPSSIEQSFKTNDLLAETFLTTRKFKGNGYAAVIKDSSDEQAIKEELPEISDFSDEESLNFRSLNSDACLESENAGKGDNEVGSDSDWDPDKELGEDKETTTVEMPTFVKRSRRQQVPSKKRCLKKLKPREQLKCDQSDCNRTFESAEKLRRHQAYIHKLKVFECSHCDWKTHVPDSISQHMQRYHGTAEDLQQLTCTICNKQFASKHALTRHKLNFHSDTPSVFTCEHCGKQITDKHSYFRHLSSVHEVKDYCRFTCDEPGCNKGFYNRRELRFHQLKHSPGEPQFKCHICGVKLRSRQSLKRHIKLHTSSNLFQCDQCPLSFTRKQYLKNHVDKIHTGNSSVEKRVSIRTGNEESRTCQECGWHFTQAWRYKRHLKTVHGPVESALEKNVLQGMERQQLKCDQKDCNRIFFSAEKLQRHQASIHKLKVLECPHCNLKTHLLDSLNRHMQRYHGTAEDLQQLTCTICNKQFAIKHSLTRHNLNFHSDTSGKKRRNVIKQSKLAEKGTAKCVCSICGAVLASKASLKLHIKSIHQKKLECCCDICGKVLRSRFYLEIHKGSVHKIGDKVRPKIPCTVEGCDKAFSSQSRVRLHVLAIHEGNPQFQCDHCGKKLVTNAHLRTHIQAIHTNRESKPFVCTVCGKGFAVKEYLWLHMKTHQPKEKGQSEQNAQKNV